MHRRGSGRDQRSGAAYTSEFHHEFKVETHRLLRRRFLWFTGLVGSFGVLSLVFGIVGAFLLNRSEPGQVVTGDLVLDWRWWLVAIGYVGLYLCAFVYALQGRPSDRTMLRLSFWVVTVDGVLNVFMRMIDMPSAFGLGGFFITHVIACAFLPWTPWQALRPMLAVLAFNAVGALLIEPFIAEEGGSPLSSIPVLIASPLLAVPGVFWCWVRHSRRTTQFKYKYMTSRYSEMRRELVDARKIHESLFPEPIETGDLHFTFAYEPMRQIGGDFLFAHRAADGHAPLSVVLLDVTGHGIPAALTVNRLHGELERVFAEHPRIGPGEVLRLLNRYVHLTLASHSIYVTAFCARVDSGRSVLEYASGGHPPAFLRAVDGTLEDLESTAIVLGACPGEEFESGERELRFGPGDTMLAYTDGAIEARHHEHGGMFRIDGLRRLISTAPHREACRWPNAFIERVADFRGGPPEDDTLFLAVHRPVGGGNGLVTASADGELSA